MSHPTDHFSYKKGSLCVESVPLSEIAEKVGTPAYIYSSEGFLKPFRELKKGLSALRDFTICYAVKSNSNVAILKMLGEHGAGADLVSGGELQRARLAKISPGKIVFSGVGKTESEIKLGLAAGPDGIFSFHVESVEELELINSVASSVRGPIARVALRFNPNIDAKTHPYISTGLKQNKFGLNRDEILQAVERAKALPWVRLCGLSIHIGSQLLSLAPLREAFDAIAEMALDVEKILGRPLEFLDLGGGVGVSYEIKGGKPPSLRTYTALIVKKFGKTSRFKSRFKILIEPGRTISANAGALVTQVLFRKPRKKKDFVVVDAGMNDLLRPALYGSKHAVLPVAASRGRSKKMKPTDLVGPVCESSDCFGRDLPLAESLAAGDLLALLSAGAYGMSMSCNYNSRSRPVEVLVSKAQWKVIRDRESFEDLIRGEHL